MLYDLVYSYLHVIRSSLFLIPREKLLNKACCDGTVIGSTPPRLLLCMELQVSQYCPNCLPSVAICGRANMPAKLGSPCVSSVLDSITTNQIEDKPVNGAL